MLAFAPRSLPLLFLAVLGFGHVSVRAADPPPLSAPRVLVDELREFEVLVKDKPIGTNTVRIVETDDGATIVATDASVVMSFIVYTYRYEFHGREKWQQNRLVQVDNRADANGKPLGARAKCDARASFVEVRGKTPHWAPPLAMTTSYWRLPPAEYARGTMSILESDLGTIHAVRLQYVGPDEVIVQNQRIACHHYRIVGTVEAELWFDGQQRLVRQKTVETGYPTEMRLLRIVRTPAAVATQAMQPAGTPRYK
jgi:hypothetical protein